MVNGELEGFVELMGEIVALGRYTSSNFLDDLFYTSGFIVASSRSAIQRSWWNFICILCICLLFVFLDRKHMLAKVMDMHCWDDAHG